ncbi:MAG: GntR family transcriptional regulator [Hyphomicrobiales bacterium]|nr:GntR family transcriptional regulator [Hyphomicrobiales bacterium]
MTSKSNGTLAEEIRRILADRIARGHIAPGVALEESELARQFGVSRTPVREAIRQLEALGFAEARPRRGAIVAAITKKRLDEMFAVMMELECLCAREAALKMTSAERGELLELHETSAAYVRNQDVEQYYKTNDIFHDLIYSGAHNKFLAELTISVRQRVAAFRRVQFSGAGRLAGSHQEHGIVVNAIQRGDGMGASEAMREHISTVRDAYQTLVPDVISLDRRAEDDRIAWRSRT